MKYESKSTVPKPFIFVLMPFDEEFNDIYKFGIKGAAGDAGAYAERVDEQIFTEGILDRIFNQISKADVIVADMTGRNSNVFYEVGYAHALGKIVLLLTQNANDIPFDLKHRPHIVYAGKIETLRNKLTERIIWAISEAKRKEKQNVLERFSVSINGFEIPEASLSRNVPVLRLEDYTEMTVSILNASLEPTHSITHIYLFTSSDSPLIPYEIKSEEEDLNHTTIDSPDSLNNQYRLKVSIPPLPPGAIEIFKIYFYTVNNKGPGEFKLRIHSLVNFYDFPFKLHT